MLTQQSCITTLFILCFNLYLLRNVFHPLSYTALSNFPFFLPLRARKERTFLSALIKRFLGVLMLIPPSGKQKKTAFISTGNSLSCTHLILSARMPVRPGSVLIESASSQFWIFTFEYL